MQRNSVAFAVDDDRAKTKWPDRMFGLNDLATVRRDCRDGFIEPAIRVEVNHDALLAGLLFGTGKQTAAHFAIIVRQ